MKKKVKSRKKKNGKKAEKVKVMWKHILEVGKECGSNKIRMLGSYK